MRAASSAQASLDDAAQNIPKHRNPVDAAARLRFKNTMSRKPTTHELEALIAAHTAEIAALKAENEKLAQRILHLEEQLRLERLHRYAPKSEKLKERIFNEAEQAAAESRDDDDVEAVAVPDTGLPEAPKPAPNPRGRKPLPDDLPRQRVEHDLPEDQKDCPCCHNRM